MSDLKKKQLLSLQNREKYLTDKYSGSVLVPLSENSIPGMAWEYLGTVCRANKEKYKIREAIERLLYPGNS
jgi:hypothetical protein